MDEYIRLAGMGWDNNATDFCETKGNIITRKSKAKMTKTKNI